MGITRLNVYAGLAGFYFLRDYLDTGDKYNNFNLPSGDYELAFVFQDRMLKENGELFYPSREGDPGYFEYIIEQGADIETGQATQLAEFFGNYMFSNG